MLDLTVTDPLHLDLVTAELHDSFYDLEDVQLTHGGELVVPFRRWDFEQARAIRQGRRRTTWEVPWRRWYLRVGNVLEYDVVDDAQIGGADFDEVSFDESARAVGIKGNVPLTISVHVQALAVSVQETSTVVGYGQRTTTLGGADSYSGDVLPGPSVGA